MVTIEGVIWYLTLIDSIGANIMAWCFSSWLKKNYKGFWKHLPTTKAWCLIYLVLVLWVGAGLYRLGII